MKSELIFEFDGVQNLSTTPLVSSGLDGDSYDYHVIPVLLDNSTSATTSLRMKLNAIVDYREYDMQGRSTTADAGVNESATSISIGQIAPQTSAKTSLSMISITGDSSEERKITQLSCRQDGGQPIIRVMDDYMKDTSTNLTSITFDSGTNANQTVHIRIYRTPKLSNNELWERIDVKTWTAEIADKTFTNLDGDRDGQYKVVMSGDSNSNNWNVRPNGDTTANYIEQKFSNNAATITSANNTGRNSYNAACRELEVEIQAVSGKKRLAITKGTRLGTSNQQRRQYQLWPNTGDNITSILIGVTGSSTTGTATLYRKRKFELADILSWETIAEHDIAGVDFSSGFSFANLLGNNYFLMRLLYFGDDSTTTSINVRLNGDATSNKSIQTLDSNNATTSALLITSTSFTNVFITEQVNRGELILYPKDGFQRPALCNSQSDEDRVRFTGYWDANTATEVTSLLAFAGNTNLINGRLELQIIRL